MTKEGFKYSILASGSSGNCFYLETAQKKILVDAGLSGKKITSLLSEINRKPEDLDAILVTHEHKDHIHGVGVLARKYNLDIYANEDGADTMIRTLGNRTKKIYLGHLSKENNIKELAHMTMVNQLAQADLAVNHDFQVLDTSPDTATPLTSI